MAVVLLAWSLTSMRTARDTAQSKTQTQTQTQAQGPTSGIHSYRAKKSKTEPDWMKEALEAKKGEK